VTNNSIDFQADLIAYPILMDTYSVSIPMPTGEVDLALANDADMDIAFLMNKRFEMKDKQNSRIHAKGCANNCRA
jgi:hypothetical protein